MVKAPSSLRVLRRGIGKLPRQPGVYLFKGARGQVLYVGKAINLRKRVCSYFRRTSLRDPRTAQLMSRVVDIEVRETASEAEALLLEAQLIKAHKPHYNVSCRNDKA